MEKKRASKQSGVVGVYWEEDREYWKVVAPDKGRNKPIGRYKDLEAAIQARLNAEQGVFPSEGEKRSKLLDKMARIRMRSVWREVLKLGPTTWTSFDHFLASVGDRPETERSIGLRNPDLPSGPDNFIWIAPKFDYKTSEGRSAYLKQHRQENLLHYKDKDLQKKFGISLEDYQRMFEEQNGVCANCKEPEKNTRSGKYRWLCVDHNHKTGKVRSLLCSNCNSALGKLQEDKTRIFNLIGYINQHND